MRWNALRHVCFLTLAFLLVGSLIVPATSVALGDGLASSPWPMFRHDPLHTGRSPFTGPQVPEMVWRYGTGDWVYSSPAIDTDGTVYFGSHDNYFYAVRHDGSLKWRFKMSGKVYSSPAISSDGTVYVGCNDQWLYAINSDGSLDWKFATGGRIRSCPVIGQNGYIYFGSADSHFYALDSEGNLKWSYDVAGNIFSSPAIAEDGTVYVGCDRQYLYAFYPNGSLKWRYSTLQGMNSSPAIGSGGTIYIGTGWGDLHAVNPDGTLKWKYQTNGSIISSPAIGSDGTVYFGSTDNQFYAVNPDGTLKWEYPTGGQIYSSPAIGSDGTIYAGSLDEYLYAFNPDGSRKWRYKAGGIYSSPAIGMDGLIFFGSTDHHLYALGEGYEPVPPVPRFTVSHENPQAGMEVTFDASDSRDPDGVIQSYEWDFGDGEAGSGEVVTHVYDSSGGYNVKLTVTDDDGYSESQTLALTVSQTIHPIASFEFWPGDPVSGQKIAFDASSSEDPDGTIESYEWDFGDGETGSGPVVTHTYSSADIYVAKLKVTDNDGFSNTKSESIAVGQSELPVASFDFSPAEPRVGMEVTFDASSSADPNGTIKKFEWDFGDGTTGTGEVVKHVYDTPGGYGVNLIVTDDDGNTDSAKATLTVGELISPIAVAEFWPAKPAVNERIAFDASGSEASNREIVSYEWDFGDGNSGDGELVTHTYEEAGEYQANLTVTDDTGRKATRVLDLTVAAVAADPDDSGIPAWVWVIVALVALAVGAGLYYFYLRNRGATIQRQEPE